MSNPTGGETGGALAVREQLDQPLTASEVRSQVNLIQKVMAEVMRDGEHYGVVPGCGTKKVLLKAGAEKLASTFRLAPSYVIERDARQDGHVSYRIVCDVKSAVTGKFLGSGVGCGSTAEDKYAWRSDNPGEWDATDDKNKRVKYTKKGQFRQVRTNPQDVENTVLKMAKKRAFVDAVLTVTAASDIFTQDIEEGDIIEAEAKVIQKAEPITPPEPFVLRVSAVEKAKDREGNEAKTRNGQPFWFITFTDKRRIVCFKQNIAAKAEKLMIEKSEVVVDTEAGSRGPILTSVVEKKPKEGPAVENQKAEFGGSLDMYRQDLGAEFDSIIKGLGFAAIADIPKDRMGEVMDALDAALNDKAFGGK